MNAHQFVPSFGTPPVRLIAWLLIFGFFAVCFCLAPPASAAPAGQSVPPPPNDNFAGAAPLAAPPLTLLGTTRGATAEDGEPAPSCAFSSAQNTVWYSIQPSESVLVLNLSGYDDVWALYRGDALGELAEVSCGYPSSNPVDIWVEAGAVYYLQVGSMYGSTGEFTLILYTTDPIPYIYYYRSNSWAYTPVHFSGSFHDPFQQNLSSFLWEFGDGATAEYEYPSHTYTAPGSYTVTFSVTTVDGRKGQATAEIIVEPLPDLSVSAGYWPEIPSTQDSISFWYNANDPAGYPITTWQWDFGDGATSTDASPTHRYADEGTYTVALTVGTHDGRRASTSLTLEVANHDVAIVRVAVPNSARVLQTKAIDVGVTSRYAGETVLVTLYKSVVGAYDNFAFVGQAQQYVPPTRVNKSTPFTFNYTFTYADAQAGSVTFKAEVMLQGQRDLQPADNTYISLPVRVSAGKSAGASVAGEEDGGILLFLPAVAGD
jgi:PKD repeat protein